MSIHQEAVIKASPGQVYECLTNGEIFAAATGQPADVTPREGEPFSIFSGRIEGRQLELVPGQRVVQAWRFGSAHDSPWPDGIYSVLRFTLVPERKATRMVLDHAAVPSEWHDHLAQGFPAFYFEPLARYFAR